MVSFLYDVAKAKGLLDMKPERQPWNINATSLKPGCSVCASNGRYIIAAGEPYEDAYYCSRHHPLPDVNLLRMATKLGAKIIPYPEGIGCSEGTFLCEEQAQWTHGDKLLCHVHLKILYDVTFTGNKDRLGKARCVANGCDEYATFQSGGLFFCPDHCEFYKSLIGKLKSPKNSILLPKRVRRLSV